MVKKIAVLLCMGSVSFHVTGQVEISEKVVLTNPNSALRQVNGLAYPDSSISAVNVSSVQSGSLIYSTATGTDTLFVTLVPSIANYKKGMVINFRSSVTNSGILKINVNGLGVVALNKNFNVGLDSAELRNGQIVSAVYDGSAFQLINKLNQPCPEGFVDVNAKYCIEVEEHDSLSFYNAMKTCGDLNGKVCSWSEWAYACQKTSLGLTNMINNFEWVDDAGNYTSSVVNARVAGSPDCVTPSSIPVNNTNLNAFRCCYYRK